MTLCTLQVQQEKDSDELFLQFPDELMRELDWREGDTLMWSALNESEPGALSLTNVSLEKRKIEMPSELKLYEVQVLVSHRVRYAVNATSAESAAAVVMQNDSQAEEFDQNCLGSQLICSNEISMETYLKDPGHVGPSAYKTSLINTSS